MNKNLWWGYEHTNKSIQVKRYFSEIDITEANQSPFVKRVFGPFDSDNREEAINIIRRLMITK